jgi:translation initiation factor eIF-2B subunit epsilon
VGANCVLEECIIGRDVHIADGVKIGRGALLGNGVRIGKGAQIPDYARVGREKWRSEYDDDSEDEEEQDGEEERGKRDTSCDIHLTDIAALREKILGKDCVGYLWPQEEELPADDSDDEGEDPFEHPSNKRLLQLGRSLSNLSGSRASLSTLSAASSSPGLSAVSDDDSSLPDVMGLTMDAAESTFQKESHDSLNRAWEEGHSVDNALVEYRLLIKGLNADLDFSRKQVVNFMLDKSDLTSGGGAPKILATTTSVFTRWGDLALQLAPHPSKAGQNEPLKVVLDVQERCVDEEELRPYFGIILRAMYEADIVDEGGLIRWRGLKRSKGDGQDEDKEEIWKETWAKGKAFVDALEEMESDDDEEESEEE